MEQLINYQGEIYSTLTGLCWAIFVILLKVSHDRVDPVKLKIIQFNISGALILLVLPFFEAPVVLEMSGLDWTLVFLSSFFAVAVADYLYLMSLKYIEASLLAVVEFVYAPSVIILSYLFWREQLTAMELFGGALVMVAGLVASRPDKNDQPITDKKSLGLHRKGMALAAISIFLMAFGVVVLKDVLVSHSAVHITFYRYVFGNIILYLFYKLFISKKPMQLFNEYKKEWRLILSSSIIGPCLGTAFWLLGFKYTVSGKAAIFNQLSSIFILVLSILFLREKLGLLKFCAMVLGLIGAILIH